MCFYYSRCEEAMISEKGSDENCTMHPTITSVATSTEEYREYFQLLMKKKLKGK